jgi:hypothetical protein
MAAKVTLAEATAIETVCMSTSTIPDTHDSSFY